MGGTCDERFAVVRDALAESLDKDDVGASVAVYVDGEPVVDIWGDYADADRTHPWERDTITNVWSTTKTMTALCALILADRGVIDLDARVATYWPEFSAASMEKLLVRHVLGHTAGLPSWTTPLTLEQLYDWPTVTALLAEQAPSSEPGAVGAYHAVTQGYLIGEVVRRVTGRSIGRFFAEEVAGPLSADFHIGLAAEDDHRVAPIIPAKARAPEIEPRGPGNHRSPRKLPTPCRGDGPRSRPPSGRPSVPAQPAQRPRHPVQALDQVRLVLGLAQQPTPAPGV